MGGAQGGGFLIHRKVESFSGLRGFPQLGTLRNVTAHVALQCLKVKSEK